MRSISSCVRQIFLEEESQTFKTFLQGYSTQNSCFSDRWRPLLSLCRQLGCKLLGITANMGMPGIPVGNNCKPFNPCYLWEHIFLFAWLAVEEDDRWACWAVKHRAVSLFALLWEGAGSWADTTEQKSHSSPRCAMGGGRGGRECVATAKTAAATVVVESTTQPQIHFC